MELSVDTTDFARVRSEVASLPSRCEEAMRRGHEAAVDLVRGQVVRTVEERTGMRPEVVEQIVKAEDEPAGDALARSTVRMTDPPPFFYPNPPTASRPRPMLRFRPSGGGAFVFARRVRGSRPYNLIGRGASIAQPGVEREYEREVGEVLS